MSRSSSFYLTAPRARTSSSAGRWRRTVAARRWTRSSSPESRRAFPRRGRIRFGPDGALYVGTGDAPAQPIAGPEQLNGKVLRVGPDGKATPWCRHPQHRRVRLAGRRHDGDRDHGPSGEMGRYAHDEVNVARKATTWMAGHLRLRAEARHAPAGDHLGHARPAPGGAWSTGNRHPELRGNVLVRPCREQIHRIVLENGNVAAHEVYSGRSSRLRRSP